MVLLFLYDEFGKNAPILPVTMAAANDEPLIVVPESSKGTRISSSWDHPE